MYGESVIEGARLQLPAVNHGPVNNCIGLACSLLSWFIS